MKRFGISISILLVLMAVFLYLRRDQSPNVALPPRTGQPYRPQPNATEVPANTAPLSGEALLRQTESRKKEALLIGQSLIAQFPDDAQCFDLSASVEYGLGGDAEKADQLWKTAIKLDPKYLPPYFGRTNIAWSQGDFDTVVELMRRVLKEDPKSTDAQSYLANALIESGRFDEAIQTVNAHRETARETVPGCLLLGKAYMQLDDYGKAVESYESAVRLNPNCWEAFYGLAQANQRLGRAEEARQNLAKFKSLRPDSVSQDNQSASDRSAETDATFVGGELLMTCLTAGEICARHGDVRGAERHWRRAEALDPSDLRSRQALQQLHQLPRRTSQSSDATF